MSILLDAVNRQKQQQTDVVDIMSIPSHQYSPPTKGSRKLNKFSVLAVTIAIGIGAAWGMSALLQSPSKQLGTVEPITAVGTQATVIAAPENLLVTSTAQPSVTTKVELAAQNNDEIRLAGKVALPIAKPFNNFSLAASVGSNVNSNPQTYTASAEADRSYSQSNQLSQANQSNDQQQDDQNEQDRIDQAAALNRQEEQAQQEIILGANANRRGLAELEALRLQVNAAAKDVDFSSVKQPSIDERNNLLAAFQTALKDVEYEHSVNQQVTEPKLDPIPTPSNNQIPKYGDLPASVQLQVPEFTINAHVYSTEPSNRWLNVDGVELQQGDMIQNKLTIVEIRPRDIVLEIDGEQFRVPAI
ncbi:general secretion pathway protein GspB [Shewanella sp. H8]|uniref:general secretion pathway protein GspB n=1 Tax=Shewanella sp. H8 TaxID=3342676 RepID=UPI0033156C40